MKGRVLHLCLLFLLSFPAWSNPILDKDLEDLASESQSQELQKASFRDATAPAIVFETAKGKITINLISMKAETITIDWGEGQEAESVVLEAKKKKVVSHTFGAAEVLRTVKIFGKSIAYLSCPIYQNLGLSSLEVSNCPELRILEIPFGNTLSKVDLSKNAKLKRLNLSGCKIDELLLPKDVTLLRVLRLSSNNIRNLELKNAVSLEVLSAPSNKLTTLDLTGCESLQELNLNLNGLEALFGISSLKKLKKMDLGKNNLPFSYIPEKGSMTEYVYNQLWYELPKSLVSGLSVDLSKEVEAKGVSDKMEQTSFEWYIFKSQAERIRIPEDKYDNKGGVFTFKESLFEDGVESLEVYVLMKNAGFPEINAKLGGLRSSMIKLTKEETKPAIGKREKLFEGLYECAFMGAKNLVTIKLPKNTKEIREKAFLKCPNLKEIGLSAEEFDLTKLDAKAFEDQKDLIIYVANETIKKQLEDKYKFKETKIMVGEPKGVANASIDASRIAISIMGRTMQVNTYANKQLAYKLYNASGVQIAQGYIQEGNSSFSYRVSQRGMYLLYINNKVIKILIHK